MKKKFLDSVGQIAIVAILLIVLVVALVSLRTAPTDAVPGAQGESGYLPPQETMLPTEIIATETPRPTQPPTVPPLTPHPPDFWPTDQPWPPSTSTPQAIIMPEIEPFPTLQFSFLDAKSPDEGLASLWYPYREGTNAGVTLEEIKVGGMGERKEQPRTRIDLGGFAAISPRLLALQKTSNNAYIAYLYGEREGANWLVYEVTSGKEVKFRDVFGFILVEFFRWSPDGEYFLAHLFENNSSSFSLVNITDGKRVMLETSEYERIIPEIDDMAFSEDGRFIAAALSYHPPSDSDTPWMNEISIWRFNDPSSREILCRGVNGKNARSPTLKWSPDGQKILWVGGLETSDVDNWVNYLWLADRSTGKCEPLIEMGISRGQGYYPVSGVYTADWSPEGSKIALHIVEEKDGVLFYRIALLDVKSRTLTDLVGPMQDHLSNVQFSPAGDLIYYTISRADYGEIWAMRLDGSVSIPVAGPTTVSAPFWIEIIQK